MKQSIHTLLFLLSVLLGTTGLSAQTVQITVLEGSEVRCCTDSIVKIRITPNPNGIFTQIKVDWGDNSPLLTILPGEPLIREHTYRNYTFCAMCKDYVCSVSAAVNGFCNQISVFADYTTIPQENVSKILTFKVRPQAAITANPGVACVGEEITFGANVCPSNDNSLSLKWTFPDGSMSTAAHPTYTFPQAQSYQVQLQILESSFVCGNGSAAFTITPLNKVVAALQADSGAIMLSANAYRVCLSGSAVVRLTAVASLNEVPPYLWSVVNPPGAAVQWLPTSSPIPTTGVVRVRFTQAGTYTFKVKINNGCDIPDEETITIEVIAAPALGLVPQKDTCAAINYTPMPNVTGASYAINGVAHSSFPLNLGISAMPYIVEGSLTNECGNQVVRDTFFIQPAQEIAITSPSTTMTLCLGGSPIKLEATKRGQWSGANGLISIMNGDTLFTPSVVGNYLLVVSIGAGVCKRLDSIAVNVVDAVALTLMPPPPGCIAINYTPEPYNASTSYTINGNVVTTFPVSLDTLGSPYTVTATANNVCGSATKTILVLVDKPVGVRIISPQDTVVCSGTAVLPLVASDTVGHWVGEHIMETAQGWTFSPDAPGTFQLIFERGSGACRRADTLQIKVEPGDGVQAGPDLFLCNTLTSIPLPIGNPSSGLLTGFGVNNGIIDLSGFVLDSAYNYTYTVTTLPAACNKDDFSITVSAPPSASFTLNQDTSCVGKTVTVMPVVPTGEHSVNWGDGTTNNLLSHQYTAAGTYDIALTVSTINPLTMQTLCSATLMHPIHIIEPIAAGNIKFSMSADSGCAVLTVAFVNSSQAENGQYFWNFGNGQTFNGYSPPPVDFQTGIEDTTYLVTLTVKNGCDSVSFSRSIKVFPLPKAKMGLSYLQPCSGGLLKASVLSTGNPKIDTFYTTTGLVRAGSVTEPTYFQFFTDSIPLTVGIYLVTSNVCGTDTAYEEIIVGPTDVVAVIGLPDTTRICVGSPLPLLNYGTTGAPIEWTISNGNTYVGDTIQPVFDQFGFYTITLKVSGCGFDSMTVPVYVHPLPTLAVAHPLSQCPHLPLDFKVTSNAADILLWYGDGDSTLQKMSQHYFPGPGLFMPTARAVSLYGCIAQWNGQLTILSPPQALAMAEDSVCVGDPVIFAGTADQPGITCGWTFGDGAFGDQCTTPHSFGSSGLFNAVFTAISAEGCRGYDTIPVYARSRPLAAFTYTIQEKCTPAKVAFVSNAVGATGLTWTLGDGTQSTLPQLEHIYQQGQTWLVTLLATNEGICSATTQQMVTVYQTPVMDLGLFETCFLDSGFNLTIKTPPSNHVQVTAPDYDRSGGFHPGLLANDYHIYIKTPQGCANDTTIVVLPVDELYLGIAQDSFSILLGDSVQLGAEVNMVNVAFEWSPNVYLDNNTIFNPESKPWKTTAYKIKATDDRGCTKTQVVYIEVIINRDSSLFIPNAFSPNADGENDIFYVRNAFNPSIKRIAEFRIFDKWGAKMFDVRDLPAGQQAVPENPYFGWDGNFRSDKAEAGVYRFQIVIEYVDDISRTFDGSLILIR